jgi:hypothetical protein
MAAAASTLRSGLKFCFDFCFFGMQHRVFSY